MSQSSPGEKYTICPRECSCSCPAGQSGAVCKHLIAVHLHTDENLFTFPPATIEMRNCYHVVAFDKEPHPDHYRDLFNLDKKPVTSALVSAADVIPDVLPEIPQEPGLSTSYEIPESTMEVDLKDDIDAMLAEFNSRTKSEKEERPKRAHNLSKNVSSNQANATKH